MTTTARRGGHWLRSLATVGVVLVLAVQAPIAANAAGGILGPPNLKKTIVSVVLPVTSHSTLKRGYKVAFSLNAGSCQPQERNYRCFAGNLVFDVCYALAATPTTWAVVCPESPWSHLVVRINLTASSNLPPPTGTKTPVIPWGLRLAGGKTCLAVDGAGGSVNGHPMTYFCNHMTGLLDTPNKTRAIWTQVSAFEKAGVWVQGPTVQIATAYVPGLDPHAGR